MTTSEEKPAIDVKWLMDMAARVAYLIRTAPGRFDRSQLFRLVEVLEGTAGGKEALMATALFALRQSKRKDQEIPPNVAMAIRDVLLGIAEKAARPEEAKELAREFLGYLRWFFEASERVRLPRMRIEDVNADWFLRQLGRKILA